MRGMGSILRLWLGAQLLGSAEGSNLPYKNTSISHAGHVASYIHQGPDVSQTVSPSSDWSGAPTRTTQLITSTSSSNSTTNNSIPATGCGKDFASSCAAALYKWHAESTRHGWLHQINATTVYASYDTAYTPKVFATSVVTLCDGSPRVLGSASYANISRTPDSYSTLTLPAAEPYTTPMPCTIGVSDCLDLYKSYTAALPDLVGKNTSLLTPPCATNGSNDVPFSTASCSYGNIVGVTGDSVQLLYWPVRTANGSDYFCNTHKSDHQSLPPLITSSPTRSAPNTFVTDGITITSPAIGLYYKGLARADGCGPTINQTIITMLPDQLSSVRGGRALFDLYPFNYADLNWMCQTPGNTSSYTVQDHGGPKCYQNVPTQAYWSAAQNFDRAMYVNESELRKWTILNDYQPYVIPAQTVWQDELKRIWGKSAVWYIDGAWDPPIALHQATAVDTIPVGEPIALTSATRADEFSFESPIWLESASVAESIEPPIPMMLKPGSSADAIKAPTPVPAVPTKSVELTYFGPSAAPVHVIESLPEFTGQPNNGNPSNENGGSSQGSDGDSGNGGPGNGGGSENEGSRKGGPGSGGSSGRSGNGNGGSGSEGSDNGGSGNGGPDNGGSSGGSSGGSGNGNGGPGSEGSGSGGEGSGTEGSGNGAAAASSGPSNYTATAHHGTLVIGSGGTANTVPITWIVPSTSGTSSGTALLTIEVDGKLLFVGGQPQVIAGQTMVATSGGLVIGTGASQVTIPIPGPPNEGKPGQLGQPGQPAGQPAGQPGGQAGGQPDGQAGGQPGGPPGSTNDFHGNGVAILFATGASSSSAAGPVNIMASNVANTPSTAGSESTPFQGSRAQGAQTSPTGGAVDSPSGFESKSSTLQSSGVDQAQPSASSGGNKPSGGGAKGRESAAASVSVRWTMPMLLVPLFAAILR